MDGQLADAVGAGASLPYRFPIRQRACLAWYHPHPHGETENHVYRGMAGFFFIEDDHPTGARLPSEYGVDDIPLLVQDIELGRDGDLVRRKPFYNRAGPLGAIILANGVVTPYVSITQTLVRLRLLNGSVSRVYNFGFSDDRAFAVVASDGGLLGAPHFTDRIQLSPGERADIVLELEPGSRSVLISFPQDLGTDPVNQPFSGGYDTFAILEVWAADELDSSRPLPSELVAMGAPREEAAARTRSFRVSSQTINGLTMDMDRIDAEVRAGSTEIWEDDSAMGQFLVVSGELDEPGPDVSPSAHEGAH